MNVLVGVKDETFAYASNFAATRSHYCVQMVPLEIYFNTTSQCLKG